MTANTSDTLTCPIGGVVYSFRTPDVYDPARARRVLTRQRVRRPSIEEFRVAALAGVAALAAAVNDPGEGQRQRALVEDWYQLLKPIDEDEIDEPDLELRAAEVARLKAEREAELQDIFPQIAAIEANLERHWQPYAELLADRNFWDDVSRIDIVRLLLVSIDGRTLARGEDGLLRQDVYQSIEKGHRLALAQFAFGLLEPDETTRKN